MAMAPKKTKGDGGDGGGAPDARYETEVATFVKKKKNLNLEWSECDTIFVFQNDLSCLYLDQDPGFHHRIARSVWSKTSFCFFLGGEGEVLSSSSNHPD